MGVVLITGCSSGFGLGSAVGFAQAGDRVYASMRTPSKQGALRKACEEAGVEVEVLQLDVTDDASVKDAVGGVISAEGRIDVLVNNAGVGWLYAIETMPDELLRQTFETNLFGTVRMLRAVLPHMRAQGSGTIVNVSSVAGHVPAPFTGFYPVTKHALRAMSEGLAMELEDHGIKVALIEPGFYRTNILSDQDGEPVDPSSPYLTGETKTREYWGSAVENGGDPQEICDLIVSVGRSADPPLHTIVDRDGWLQGRFALDDAGWAGLIRTTVGY
jgi:NAD(P)-dependent dehydrogenase (short-subunit alcohol dehydrogenase family)